MKKTSTKKPVKAAKKSSAKPAPKVAASKPQSADQASQIAALNKAQAVIQYSADGKIVDVNDQFLMGFGYAVDEVRGQHHSMLVDPAHRTSPEYQQLWEKLGRGESAGAIQLTLAKGGNEHWVHASYSPMRDKSGAVCKIFCFLTDITETKTELDSVRAELEVRTKIMNETSIVSEADKKGDILSINDKFIEVSKYSKDELIGNPHNTTRHPDMPKDTFKQLWATIGRGNLFRGVIKNRAKDGTPYYVDAVIAPFMGKNGKPMKYLGVRYDITKAEIERQNMKGVIDAINKSYASIEFDLKGNITAANPAFLSTVGYTAEEVIGQHHSMFVEQSYRTSADYRMFWEKLGRGEYDTGQYKRFGKGGKEIWIQASYNPICDEMGRPFKVVKYATDITEQKQKFADYEGQIAAIGKAQAVIEFSMDGRIRNANDNFLSALGYSMDEVRGQHHSMFVDPAHRSSAEYRMFWEKLGRGEFDSGQYKRIAKGGREIWIQASYNPIMDMNGKPFKVVKYATDVTEQVKSAQMMQQAVEQTQEVVSATKDGDLMRRIPLEGKSGSIESLCAGVNSLVDTFAGIVGQIKTASDAINTAAKEIASGNSDLSARTEQQAASLEETASSMEELTSTVKQNAENAKQANQLAIGASDIALKGGKVVSEVVNTMSAINESSKKIVDIISVIDGIAFQTNILALNAAVEAARAGEQGRGFAVVAAEVRSLAQRSAGAAKEIKSLIGDSVEKVGNGAKLVDQAGKTMEEIVTSVKRVTDIMSEISAASQEQSSGIEQVNTTITQMDEVTQQNAALVEEATASARSLEEQATGLTLSVSAFKLDELDVRSVATAAPAQRQFAPALKRPASVIRPAPARPVPVRAPTAAAPKRAVSNGASGKQEEQWTEF